MIPEQGHEPGRPLGERLEHPVLRTRRVLHFIDEQVSQLVIQQQRNVARLVGGTECIPRIQRHFDVVADTALGKQALELDDRQGQQSKQSDQHLPLFLAVSAGRELAYLVQSCPEGLLVLQ